MKYYLLAFVIAILAIQQACNPATPKVEERVEYLESGAVARRVTLIDGKREGKMIDYYPDGKLMAERGFKQGRQEGKTLVYYPSGAIKEVQYYLNGEQHGGDTLWYEDGKIQFTVFFQNNKKNGYLRKWAPDGGLIFESKYAMDTLVEVKGEVISREAINARHEGDTVIRPAKQ
jgi:hypothetical protein